MNTVRQHEGRGTEFERYQQLDYQVGKTVFVKRSERISADSAAGDGGDSGLLTSMRASAHEAHANSAQRWVE